MKRTLDLILGVLAGMVLVVSLVFVTLTVRLSSKGPVLYWSDRTGRNNVILKMPNYRSMRVAMLGFVQSARFGGAARVAGSEGPSNTFVFDGRFARSCVN